MNMPANDKILPGRQTPSRPLLRAVIVGHVDHGKSTLIGRLLHETGSLPEGKLQSINAVSDRRGVAFEWSFLLDALQTERDQGITLDTSQTRLRTASRDIVLIDAPGHAEFVRNMITGAAQADAALLVIDASEGVREQTRRHVHLLRILGISQLAVVVNKMDRVDYAQSRFVEIQATITRELSKLGFSVIAIVPSAARHGDGVARRTPSLAWHSGPTVLEILESFSPAKPLAELPLRIPVQAVYRFDDRRIVAGRIESGRLAVGDEVTILPRGATARVRSIERWPASADPQLAAGSRAGQSVGLTLDGQIFVERGEMIASPQQSAIAGRRLRARVFWLHQEPLSVGSSVGVRVGTAECSGKVTLIENAIDPGELAPSTAQAIARNHIGEIEIALTHPIAVDVHAQNPRTGRLVLDFAGRISGGGPVLSVDGEPVGVRDRVQTDTRLAMQASRLNRLLGALPAPERIARFCRELAGRPVFTTSFGLEDQAILHMLHEQGLDIDVLTLDTGRLFRETYQLWSETEQRYGRRIRAIYPDHTKLESLVADYGINGFYASRAARAACCHVRKVEPLDRALAGAPAWIVGLRADQSSNRRTTALTTVDARGLLKFSPLFDWTRDVVQTYIAAHQIPVNPLHARGFASIGCAPCTRAIAPGEPERAGRWWWEQDGKKECGLHSAGRDITVAEPALP